MLRMLRRNEAIYRRHPTLRFQHRYVLIALSFLVTTLFIYISARKEDVVWTAPSAPPEDIWSVILVNKTKSNHFTIKTEGCFIPAMKSYSDDIVMDSLTDKHLCLNIREPYYISNKTHIMFMKDPWGIYTGDDITTTIYRPFYRSVVNGSFHIVYKKSINFNDTIRIGDEFVRITIKFHYKEEINEYFITPVKKQNKKTINKIITAEKPSYNVIVIIDNMSQLLFRKYLPKTQKFFTNNDAIEMYAYNIVHPSLFSNSLAFLTGHKASGKNKCYSNSALDSCNFVWDEYRKFGFYTAFVEDAESVLRFNRKPTNYYTHTFLYESLRNEQDKTCVQGKYIYQTMLDYYQDLSTILKSERIFSVISRAFVGKTPERSKELDNIYANLLSNLNENNILNNSILFFISHHGLQQDPGQVSKHSRMEAALPLFYVMTPSLFSWEYSEAFNNLEGNSGRLITPFDLYDTLQDLADISRIKNKRIRERIGTYYSKKRGISLFLPIPENRSCIIAGIAKSLCFCA